MKAAMKHLALWLGCALFCISLSALAALGPSV